MTTEHILPDIVWSKSVKERDGHKCLECGSTEELHAHHKLPRIKGGENLLSNGITLCRSCHWARHNGDGWVQGERALELRARSLKIPPDIDDRLKEIATAQKRSVNSQIAIALEQWLVLYDKAERKRRTKE